MGISIDPYRILPLPFPVKRTPYHLGSHWHIPVLTIPWNSFQHGFRSSLDAVFGGPRAPKQFLGGQYFRDCWVEHRIPMPAVVLAAVLQVIFFLLPYPQMPAVRRAALPQDNVELTWSAPALDLPAVDFSSDNSTPQPGAGAHPQPGASLPRKGVDAYHPRQTIFTDSLHPTHPRQTLINSAAPREPPKILPPLPNIVLWAQASHPDRPRLLIDREELAKLRPKQQAVRPAEDVPLPQVPNVEKQISDLNLAVQSPAIAKPVLPLNASVAPRVGPRATRGESSPAPDLQPAAPNSSASQTFIALSSAPAPPPPQLPLVQGNLSARLTISPESPKPGSAGEATNKGALGGNGDTSGSNSSGGMETSGRGNRNIANVSISGGSPTAISPVSGLRTTPPVTLPGVGTTGASRGLPDNPSSRHTTSDATRKTSVPNLPVLPPGAKPENVLGAKKIYTLHVNMPNLSSGTGSWILSFTELREDIPLPGNMPGALPASHDDLSGPVPLHKVDPKYPPALIQEKVEGEVVLYAVIRRDGSVDSIQLVSGLDQQLDTNAMEALSRWKFRPGERAGTPVELEAIVHIPFRVGRSRF